MEFVEMFKAPIKVLHPLLTATQEGNYNSTEGLGAIPFTGILLAHSNESEWHTFRNNKNNEAFIDRIYIVKVPYCLRVSDEVKIYDKLLFNSSLAKAHCAPDTLKMLAQFTVLSRLKEPENSNIYSKMRVYDGENLKDTDPKAKSIQEYRDPETGEILNRVALNEELEKIEKPAGISNPKDFRNEIVNFVLRARANNNGKNPTWLS